MAERRMFSRSVVTSDAFLDLSLGAQALYLQLAMQADDDGIIANPRRIERMLGTGGGAREELLGCGFLLPLDGGLVAITHWRVQNLLRRDRYKPTRYSREAAALTVAESGEYVLSDVAAAAWQPKGDRAAPEDRVGESSGIEDSGGESSDRPTAPCISDRADAPAAHAAPITPNTATASSPDRTSGAVHPTAAHISEIRSYGAAGKVRLTAAEHAALGEQLGDELRDRAIAFLDAYIEEKGYRSKSHAAAIRRWVADAVRERDRRGGSRDRSGDRSADRQSGARRNPPCRSDRESDGESSTFELDEFFAASIARGRPPKTEDATRK